MREAWTSKSRHVVMHRPQRSHPSNQKARSFRKKSDLESGDRSAMAGDDFQVEQLGGKEQKPEHLLVMVNGLFGHMDNWKVIKRSLEAKPDASKLLMLASNTNRKLQTFDGIDVCGKRLAEELQAVIDKTPSLKYISVFGHSMGGLISRNCLGLLYDSESRKIAGLQPRHFISLAAPHLGCGGKGPAQIPFIKWFNELPLVGYPLGGILYGLSNPFAWNIMRRTGRQFFMLDKEGDQLPLLVRMAEDSEREPFLSSLKSFASRTCLANSSGDHLVGWANASVRAVDELPDLKDVSKAKGIIRADDTEKAFWHSHAELTGANTTPEKETAPLLKSLSRKSDSLHDEPIARDKKGDSSQGAMEILKNLQTLPWCRIDCSFKGTLFPFFAHNLIQVTREWINWEGEDLTKAIANHFFDLERVLDQQTSQKTSL